MTRAAVLVLVLAAACRGHQDVYPADVVTNFMTTCTTRSPKPVCRCAIDAVQERFTLEQFRAFELRLQAGDLPKEIMDAVAGCRE
jgi:hypothetical protein